MYSHFTIQLIALLIRKYNLENFEQLFVPGGVYKIKLFYFTCQINLGLHFFCNVDKNTLTLLEWFRPP